MSTADHPSDGFRTAVLVESSVALVAAFLAWLFAVTLRDQFPQDIAKLVRQCGVGLVATLPMLALFFALMRSQHPTMRQLREQVDWLIREIFPTGHLGHFALVALLAGVGEELLFRGVLQAVLGEQTTPAIGLVLASALFGCAHAVSRTYFVLATLIGVYLGAIWWYFGDLVAPIVAHGVYDFIALTYLSRSGDRHSAG